MSEWHAQDAVNVANLNEKSVLTANIDQAILGVKTFDQFPITPSAYPTADYEVANKKYVDDYGGAGGGLPLDVRGWTFTGTFTATDYNTVTWSSGDLSFSNGTTYAILSGTTGTIVAPTYIFFDTAVSTTELQTTIVSTASVGAGKLMMAFAEDNSDATKNANYQAFGGKGGVGVTITAANVVADSLTGNEILANTITAYHIDAASVTLTELNFIPLTSSGATGAVIATINASVEGITIDAANLSISAVTTFSSGYDPIDKYDLVGNDADDILDGTTYATSPKVWKHASDVTKIDGGVIYTGTVVLSALAFTAVQDSNVIASINASSEGGGTLNIDAAKIAISGSVTFSSGYDPTDKFDLTGNDADDVTETGSRRWAAETGANVTGSHTAANTTNVGSVSAANVAGWAHSSDETTVDGGQVYVGSHLVVGTGNNVGVVSGSDATYRLWCGHLTAASAPFRVTQAGAATMTNATISSSTGNQKIVIDSSTDRFSIYADGTEKIAMYTETISGPSFRTVIENDYFDDHAYIKYYSSWRGNAFQMTSKDASDAAAAAILLSSGGGSGGSINVYGISSGVATARFTADANVNTTGSYKIAGTDVIDSSKNLTNINSWLGNFTSSGQYMYHNYEHDTSYPTLYFQRAKASGSNLSAASVLGWIGFLGKLSGSYQGLGAIYGYCNNVSTKASDIYMGVHNGTSLDIDAWIFQADGDAYASAGSWTTFTGSHVYQSSKELKVNSAVVLLDDGTVDYTNIINDNRFVGVVIAKKEVSQQNGKMIAKDNWKNEDEPEFNDYEDSIGNTIKSGNMVYVVAAVGDCLTGKNDGVRVIGNVTNGDFLCTSETPGCLQTQPEIKVTTVDELIEGVETKMAGRAMKARETITVQGAKNETVIYATFEN